MIEFTLNSLGMEALLNSPELAADMEARVKAVAERARNIAPYSLEKEETDVHYRDQIKAGTFIAHFTGSRGEESRVTGYVQADVPWATAVEVRHRTLGSAVGGSGSSQ